MTKKTVFISVNRKPIIEVETEDEFGAGEPVDFAIQAVSKTATDQDNLDPILGIVEDRGTFEMELGDDTFLASLDREAIEAKLNR